MEGKSGGGDGPDVGEAEQLPDIRVNCFKEFHRSSPLKPQAEVAGKQAAIISSHLRVIPVQIVVAPEQRREVAADKFPGLFAAG